MRMKKSLIAGAFLLLPWGAQAGELTVRTTDIVDNKPVFATVESTDVTAARARTGGVVVDLKVDEGVEVTQGQVVAVVGDDKLALQIGGLDAQVAAAQAQQKKAADDLRRAQELFRNGTVAKAQLDSAKAAFDVADNQLRAVTAQRSVVDQQVREGQILAPASGRVLDVPITKGSVLMPGEVAARIAADGYILRLQLPERHAQAIRVGDTIRLDDGRTGTIRQVYPEIVNGRVQADADVPDLGGYFVGQRVRVFVRTGTHRGFVVPLSCLRTHSGVDYVVLVQGTRRMEVPVQRGEAQAEGVEVVAGLRDGDVLQTEGE